MPSPLAHTAVAFVLWPLLIPRRRVNALQDDDVSTQRRPALASPRNLVLVAGIVFMLNAPDLDFIPHLLSPAGSDLVWLRHGDATHSIFVGAAAAVLFATAFRGLVNLGWMRLWLIGALAWWSHILLDFFTWRGGVAALWPLTDQRFASPVPLFYGVRHSEPWAWHLHLITIGSELIFVMSLWIVGCWLRSRQRCTEPSSLHDLQAESAGKIRTHAGAPS